MDSGERAAERRWKQQPKDTAAARAYVKHLVQKGEEGLNALANLLSNRPFDLRYLLMNRHADSYGFWGIVEGIGFKVTVTNWGDCEGWCILKHYGDRPVIDDESMGPNPPHPTQILIEWDDNGLHCWRTHDEVPDDESESSYEDVYDAIRDAIHLCDGLLRPFETEAQ